MMAEDAPFRAFTDGAGTLLKALYQLAVPELLANKTVGVLFRTNNSYGQKIRELEKAFVHIIRHMGWPREKVKKWQTDQIRFSTAHKFKGMECKTVFVVGPHTGCFPLINAGSIELFRFFGDTVEQAETDERRLFYVALTRAEERLVFLTETRREDDSPYLTPIRHLIRVTNIADQPLHPRKTDAISKSENADDDEPGDGAFRSNDSLEAELGGESDLS